MNRLDLPNAQHELLWDHLLDSDSEQVAFAFAEAICSEDGVIFRVVDVYLVPPNELLTQHAYHISLTDEAQAKIIKAAWDARSALIEFHSHLDFRFSARFSPSDLDGLDTFVPHVRWRLKGQPYLAVVVAPSGFDALVWRKVDPEALDCIDVGCHSLKPTNSTIRVFQTEWDT